LLFHFILFFILQIGQTVLHMVSITGEPRLCALFLRANADPNLADDRQFRPIHWACMQGHKAVVCILFNVLVEIADPLPDWGLHWLEEIGHTTGVLR
jgi:ankyrin repeat protein